MTPSLRPLLAAALAASFATAAPAHHSMAVFDMSRQVTLQGVVSRVEWVNPHVYVYIDVASETEGATVSWEIEGFPPAGMRRMGWSQDTLIAGSSIQVTGNPARTLGARSIFPSTIQQGDNTLLDMQAAFRLATQPAPPPKTGSAGLDGVWETQVRLRLYPHFFTGRARRNLTEAAAAAAAQYDHATMSPAIQCILNPPPFSMMISDLKRITTDANVIRISGDFDGGERLIHMNVDSRRRASDSVLGHSVGRWDGETLVIHTTHFSPHAAGNGMGVPSGPGKELVERLTLNEDRTILTYHFELSDPDFLTAPLADDVVMYFRPAAEFATEPCDTQNARRYLEY